MQQQTIEGSVERITYYNAETGYCVLRMAPTQPHLSRRGQLLTIVGTMPEIQPGETIKCTGNWETHSQHGRQFKAEIVVQVRPASIEGIKRYLGSGLVKGVGPKTAKRIVDFFGAETLDVLDRTPQRVLEVPSVGKHRSKMIAEAWEEQRAVKEVMLFLQSYQINTALAVKIYKTYGDRAMEQVQSDPYQLVRDIRGVGFRTADKIARSLGLPPYSPARLKAGLIYALNEATSEGHVYLPTDELIQQASQLLEIEPEHVEEILQNLSDEKDVVIEDIPDKDGNPMQVAYHSAMYYSEKGVAKKLKDAVDSEASRLADLSRLSTSEWERMLDNITRTDGIILSEQQRSAVQMALTSKISILTGGPGTGKTTTLRTIIGVLEATNHRYKLASPTGRAAKRLSEATGQPAQTIHRLLGFSAQGGFNFNEDEPLDTDMVVVDEASMIDLVLFYNLVKAIRPHTHLLLVGDVDQLPSVGAGDVLRDLIKSHICPVVKLEAIFRQAGNSMIIRNAHRINNGENPDTRNESDDFFFFGMEEPEAAAELLVDIVQNRIPSKFGFDPMDDIQVLAPMYQGRIGVNTLNSALQETLNSGKRKAEKHLSGTLFRVGDKVMQTRNNYDKEVFNGDIGRVDSFHMVDHVMNVVIDGRKVAYDWTEADQLTLAYAISVHKSQGAEYPVVVMPVLTQHYMMLQRNLLYTAVTRARKMVVLVGTRKAIAIAVRNNKVAERYTALDWRLSY